MVAMAHDETIATALATLTEMRNQPGRIDTPGLPDDIVARFAASDPRLLQAIEQARSVYDEAARETPGVLTMDESDQVTYSQQDILNFYAPDVINPYVAAGAQGPWLVTLKGAVIYDVGGYGMLGWGHNPEVAMAAMGAPQVMANVMTPNLMQRRFTDALRTEIGQTGGGCPFAAFMCLNSGSEAMSLASRIADTLSATRGAETVKRVVVEGGFHGRTERPALLSDSSRGNYRKLLASFKHDDSVLTVPPGDVAALEAVFAEADRQGWFVELMALEPVMGEGNPGYAITREFYEAARRLTLEHGSLLLIDSVQAGLRTHGYLSVVDHPQLAGCEAPDMESYSKAINGGQYPLSVLALGPRAVDAYRLGTYGNTMTGNPRALAVAVAVLDALDDAARTNIREQGIRLTEGLAALAGTFPGVLVGAQGTGLLVSCEVAGLTVYGRDSLEEWLRRHGLGVIHGGQRSLRFTPVFDISDAEVELIIDMVRTSLRHALGQAAA